MSKTDDTRGGPGQLINGLPFMPTHGLRTDMERRLFITSLGLSLCSLAGCGSPAFSGGIDILRVMNMRTSTSRIDVTIRGRDGVVFAERYELGSQQKEQVEEVVAETGLLTIHAAAGSETDIEASREIDTTSFDVADVWITLDEVGIDIVVMEQSLRANGT